MVSNLFSGSAAPATATAPDFRQSLAAKINQLKSRDTIVVALQKLPLVHDDRRAAFAWFRERNCYVKYVHKRQVIELRKM